MSSRVYPHGTSPTSPPKIPKLVRCKCNDQTRVTEVELPVEVKFDADLPNGPYIQGDAGTAFAPGSFTATVPPVGATWGDISGMIVARHQKDLDKFEKEFTAWCDRLLHQEEEVPAEHPEIDFIEGKHEGTYLRQIYTGFAAIVQNDYMVHMIECENPLMSKFINALYAKT